MSGCLIFENVAYGYLKNCKIYNAGITTKCMNPFDLYRNVKEFTIESCFFQTNTADDEGGSWVRNHDLSNATESVYITNSSFETTQEDEPFAVFIPQDTNSVVKDVFVTGCSFFQASPAGPDR